MEAAIRGARPEEAEAICRLINAAFAVERAFIAGQRTSPGEVRMLMEQGELLVAAGPGGELVGCVHVAAAPPEGRFAMLSVDPARQGSGLGRSLVAAAEDWCRARGCRAVAITIVNRRRELPGFYRALGYRETGEVRPFSPEDAPLLKVPAHFVCMRKELEAPR